jgi:regulator of sirC expression with transglutaminase-like and TPR domain
LKKDHLAFLFGGLAFGFLLGFGLFRVIETRPGRATTDAAAPAEIPGPMGPAAPSQTEGGGAPMMAEINALKERVQSDPKDVGAWTRLANLYQDVGMFEPAIEFYNRAIELAPTDANLLTDLGICYQKTKQFDRALDSLERAQKADPANWQSLYNIVVVAGLEMRRLDKADAALARLEKIHPDAPNLGQLREALDKVR